MRRLALAVLLAATPVLADTPMTAEEFDAYATGKTLTYGLGGVTYGTEMYLPGRRVLWAFSGDTCQEGTWYPKGDQICFAYEVEPEHQCWIFTRTANGLRAQFIGDSGTDLSEVAQTNAPLNCSFNGVGV